jgi:hypothetical protein
MPGRSSRIAAVALTALASFPFDASSDSGALQDPRRSRWMLAVQHEAAPLESPELSPKLSPPGGGIGWVKAGEAKPDCALQLKLEEGWALYADWDRYRTKLPQVRETVDTVLVGLQLKFR